MAVAHILRQKGSDVVTVSPSDSVQSIVDTLSRHRIGAVVVVDGTGAISGIVSERDVVRAMSGDVVGGAEEHRQGHHDVKGDDLPALIPRPNSCS